jgi:nucleotidyltransferase AbiEii toxin of type IV toxin-antitoxin system
VAAFDRRIVEEGTLRFLQACQARVPFHLGGGAALAGVHLRHRLSQDADLFFHDREAHRDAVRLLPDISLAAGVSTRLVRDAGTFVRATLESSAGSFALDLVHEPVEDIGPPSSPVEGIVIESLEDLRANKLTCLLSRSEPRDLVDLLFLDRAGFPPEQDLPLALRKDAGIDPAILGWLLAEFPVDPLPIMLLPLDREDLRRFRDDLAERFRRLSLPPEPGL